MGVEVRIGITQAPREISLELDDSVKPDDLKKKVEEAMAGKVQALWLTDKKGKQVAIPAEKIAYVEIGSADSSPRIGFGG